jgi:ATP-dependent DNA helicase RecG
MTQGTRQPSAPVPLSERSVTALKGVGDKLAELLARLGIRTVQDLLFHLPQRYEDRTQVTPIGALGGGGDAVVEGEVELAEVVFRPRRQLLARISDGTGTLTLRFFHFSRAQQEGLARGMRLRCFGEARRTSRGLEMVHPEYRATDPGTSARLAETLTPIYPATEGLQQGRLRGLTTQALMQLDRDGALEELLPEAVRARHAFPELKAALRYAHRPPAEAALAELGAGRHPTQRRLAFEELLAHHLSLKRLRQITDAKHAAPLAAGKRMLVDSFIAGLPWPLTGAQRRVAEQCFEDLARPRPMMRLVQGDVGSGKTVVAALALLRAVEAGRQACLMAPTELLAEQHFRNLDDWFAPLGLTVEWLAGKQTARARGHAAARIRSGNAEVVVGTHALFQEAVRFDRLGLVVIDEQHRFGVHQRLTLAEKGARDGSFPHQLIMTATPIPRTLAMTAYADLDVSVIDELPPGRTPVQTVVIPEARRAEVVQRVEHALAEGRQVYWVCPLISESEQVDCEAAEATHAALAAALAHRRVGLVHGKLKPRIKEQTMAAFKRGELDLLVATTVIEVGVDVPNASVMIVENAERLGLAQLHQLRGRVGRGAAASSCVLLYKGSLGPMARARLACMRETNDGFEISRRDLELRGPGEVLGTRQTGLVEMHIADLVRDADLLPAVQAAADEMLAHHADQVAPLVARWIGEAERYKRA